jgi:hypothetical protein
VTVTVTNAGIAVVEQFDLRMPRRGNMRCRKSLLAKSNGPSEGL